MFFSLLGSLPVLSAHSFASNWQLLFLNQRKRENSRRNVFITKYPRKNVLDRGIELGAACMPSGHASNLATAPGARCFDGRKNNFCNVSKPVVHALHSNFAKDSLEIWDIMLTFHIKTGVGAGGGGGNVSWKIKGIFSSWVRFLQAVSHEVSTWKYQNGWNVLFNEE